MSDTTPTSHRRLLIAVSTFVVLALALFSTTILGSPSPQAAADTQASSYLNLVNFYNQGSTPGAFAETALNKAAATYPGVTIDSYSPARAILSVDQGGTTYQVCVDLTAPRTSRFCQVATP